MKPLSMLVAGAVALVMVACAPAPSAILPATGPTAPAPPFDGPACPSPDYMHLVGQPQSALADISYDGVVRAIRPGMMVTMDYSPTRLNIEFDAQGRITRIYCG